MLPLSLLGRTTFVRLLLSVIKPAALCSDTKQLHYAKHLREQKPCILKLCCLKCSVAYRHINSLMSSLGVDDSQVAGEIVVPLESLLGLLAPREVAPEWSWVAMACLMVSA